MTLPGGQNRTYEGKSDGNINNVSQETGPRLSRVAPRRSEATVPLKGVFSPNTFLFFAIVVSFENQRCLSETAHTTSSNEIQPAEQNREPTRGGGRRGFYQRAQLAPYELTHVRASPGDCAAGWAQAARKV